VPSAAVGFASSPSSPSESPYSAFSLTWACRPTPRPSRKRGIRPPPAFVSAAPPRPPPPPYRPPPPPPPPTSSPPCPPPLNERGAPGPAFWLKASPPWPGRRLADA
jgi:hypothetical protein